MTGQLRIDLDAVRDTAVRLGYIGTHLEGAESSADELATMIPHAGLARAVGTFGNDWDVARTTLVEKLEGLRQAADGVAQTFAEADGKLAHSVTGG